MTSEWDRRGNNFDFIRLALAVLVIYSHSFPLGLGSEDAEPVKRLTHGQLTGGGVAVDLFFIMSGFLITASAERSAGWWTFMKKRVARIYPAFCVLALVTAIVVMPWAGAHMSEPGLLGRAGNFFLQTARLREFAYVGAFRGNPFPGAVNGSAWSVQYEFWCYVGVALVTGAGLLQRRGTVLAAFLASVVMSVLFQVRGWMFGGKWLGVLFGSPQLWARLLPLYLAGVAFYLFRDRIRLNGWLAVGAVLGLGVGAWLRFGCAVAMPVAGAYLVFYLAYAPWLRMNGFGRFGDFSYGTYLYAFPVQQIVMKEFGHPVSAWMLFVCATPLTLLLACASWYGVERRYLGVGRRKMALA